MNVIDPWLNDTNVLADLSIGWNDKLKVVGEYLQLKKGTRLRSSGTLIMSQPKTVADHIEKMITVIAKTRFENLRQQENEMPSYYEDVADFKRQIKYVRMRTSDLEYTFRSHDCNNKILAKRYSSLHKKAHKLCKEVKKYKETLIEPPLELRPVKHIEYSERSTFVKWSYPKRVPIEDTVAAAMKALDLANSIEKPASPLLWLLRNFIKPDNPHKRAYQVFCTQIFHRPYITEEVAAAFQQLAPEADLLDLENAVIASDDMIEFTPYIKEIERKGAIPIADYLSIMQQLCKRKNIKLQTLESIKRLYKQHNKKYLRQTSGQKEMSVDHFLDEASSDLQKDVDCTKAHATSPYVSPLVLRSLLSSATLSPTCKKIQLSRSILELKFVHDFLLLHSYKIKENLRYQKIYERA